MATVLEDEAIPEMKIPLTFKWSGREYKVDLLGSDRVYDLKTSLMSLTKVPPERQKILGLVKGKLPPDQERIADLRIAGKSFTLIGTPEGDEIKDPSKLEFLPDVVNDLDVDFTDNLAAAAVYINDQRNIRKVKEATEKLQINIIHPLRDGKRLLVLDIDYTILDTKPLTSGSLPPDEFLDKTCMFTIFTERNGQPYTHQVKALQIIWNHFPQFSAENTIHVDDLSRNFALNPNEGLKIHAFKNAHTEQAQADRELAKIARYMVHIAGVEDFRTLRHKSWKHELRRLPQS
ncbi:HAD subfamily IIID h [Suillus ampliporus]|nr:HAD subfamily IIID h [Suillus ampliporus]